MTSKLVAHLYRKVRNGNAKQMLLYALLQTVALFDKFLDWIYISPYSGVYILLDSIQSVHHLVYWTFSGPRILRKHFALFFQ